MIIAKRPRRYVLGELNCFVWQHWQLPKPFFDSVELWTVHKENEKARFGNKKHVELYTASFLSGALWRRRLSIQCATVGCFYWCHCWAEAPIKIARMTLTIKLDGNWSSFQLANSAPPLSVTDSAIAPSARMPSNDQPEQHTLETTHSQCTWRA